MDLDLEFVLANRKFQHDISVVLEMCVFIQRTFELNPFWNYMFNLKLCATSLATNVYENFYGITLEI